MAYGLWLIALGNREKNHLQLQCIGGPYDRASRCIICGERLMAYG
jgi:hypothetical protein